MSPDAQVSLPAFGSCGRIRSTEVCSRVQECDGKWQLLHWAFSWAQDYARQDALLILVDQKHPGTAGKIPSYCRQSWYRQLCHVVCFAPRLSPRQSDYEALDDQRNHAWHKRDCMISKLPMLCKLYPKYRSSAALLRLTLEHPSALWAGVLQVEAMAQLGGIVMMDPEDQTAKKNFFFGGIDGCKFRRPVVPGDTLVCFTPISLHCTSLSHPLHIDLTPITLHMFPPVLPMAYCPHPCHPCTVLSCLTDWYPGHPWSVLPYLKDHTLISNWTIAGTYAWVILPLHSGMMSTCCAHLFIV